MGYLRRIFGFGGRPKLGGHTQPTPGYGGVQSTRRGLTPEQLARLAIVMDVRFKNEERLAARMEEFERLYPGEIVGVHGDSIFHSPDINDYVSQIDRRGINRGEVAVQYIQTEEQRKREERTIIVD